VLAGFTLPRRFQSPPPPYYDVVQQQEGNEPPERRRRHLSSTAALNAAIRVHGPHPAQHAPQHRGDEAASSHAVLLRSSTPPPSYRDHVQALNRVGDDVIDDMTYADVAVVVSADERSASTPIAIEVASNSSHRSARHDVGRTDNAASLSSSYVMSATNGDRHEAPDRCSTLVSSSTVQSLTETVDVNDDDNE
jgi:hypothetical protein